MGLSRLTCEASIAIYDDDHQRWGNYGDPINLVSLEITNPDPTTIKDVSSRPDSTFGQTVGSDRISTGSPAITISTRDLVNRDTTPVDFQLLAAALSASESALTIALAANHYFNGVVDRLGRNIDTGKRNLTAASTVVHKQSALDGLMTGSIASANTGVYTVTAAGWTVDALINKKIMITAGTGAGQVVSISDNTATTLTATLSPAADSTSRFAIVEATALVRDSDYSVDETYGTVKPMVGGSVAAENTLHGFVTSKAITGTRLVGAAKNTVKFRVRGKAKDMKSGDLGFLTIHQIIATSSEAQQFVANVESPEYKMLTLSGEMETPTGQAGPYMFDTALTYAAT